MHSRKDRPSLMRMPTVSADTATILVVDDSPTVRLKLTALLKQEGYTVHAAGSGEEAVAKCRRIRPQCILLDLVLGDESGVSVVARIRDFDPHVQIVVVTGHSDNYPGRRLMRDLDIQGYYSKSDRLMNLLIWVEASLKAYANRKLIQRQADAMRRVLAATPEIHKIQPRRDLLECGLDHMTRLIPAASSRAMTLPLTAIGGWAVCFERSGEVHVVATTHGSPNTRALLDALDPQTAARLRGLNADSGIVTTRHWVIVPVIVRDTVRAAFLFRTESPQSIVRSYLELLSNEVAIALQNIDHYQMATTDPLTNLASRGHVQSRLTEWLKRSSRTDHAMSLIFIDLDGLKTINDSLGHVAGDNVIAAVGQRIESAVRDVDLPGRIGGDEFVVLLPMTCPLDAVVVARRIERRLTERPVVTDEHVIHVSASVGCGGFETLDSSGWAAQMRRDSCWERLSNHFIELVDSACYAAKRSGGGRVSVVDDNVAESLREMAGEILANEACDDSDWATSDRGLGVPGEDTRARTTRALATTLQVG